MVKLKNAQITGEVLKYGLVLIFSVVILAAGYRAVSFVQARNCKTEISKFEIDLRALDKNSLYGTKELKSYFVPCSADEIYFFDRSRDIDPEIFSDSPIIQNSVTGKSGNNIFMVKEGQFIGSFSGGNIEIEKPHYICFRPKNGKISFFQEGAGNSAKISVQDGQPECTAKPVEISQQEASNVVDDAFQFGSSGQCANCPANSDSEKNNAEKTKGNVEITRAFELDAARRKTEVKIVINALKGSRLRQFRFYEQIPKSCIGNLQQLLEGAPEKDNDVSVEIKADPLIVWFFNDVSGKRRVSYRLNTILSEQCQQLIKGLGVAEFIEGGGEGEH